MKYPIGGEIAIDLGRNRSHGLHARRAIIVAHKGWRAWSGRWSPYMLTNRGGPIAHRVDPKCRHVAVAVEQRGDWLPYTVPRRRIVSSWDEYKLKKDQQIRDFAERRERHEKSRKELDGVAEMLRAHGVNATAMFPYARTVAINAESVGWLESAVRLTRIFGIKLPGEWSPETLIDKLLLQNHVYRCDCVDQPCLHEAVRSFNRRRREIGHTHKSPKTEEQS